MSKNRKDRNIYKANRVMSSMCPQISTEIRRLQSLANRLDLNYIELMDASREVSREDEDISGDTFACVVQNITIAEEAFHNASESIELALLSCRKCADMISTEIGSQK